MSDYKKQVDGVLETLDGHLENVEGLSDQVYNELEDTVTNALEEAHNLPREEAKAVMGKAQKYMDRIEEVTGKVPGEVETKVDSLAEDKLGGYREEKEEIVDLVDSYDVPGDSN